MLINYAYSHLELKLYTKRKLAKEEIKKTASTNLINKVIPLIENSFINKKAFKLPKQHPI